MPLGEQCGFCERYIDDEEELVPIYVGEPDVDHSAPTGATVEWSDKSVVDADGRFDTAQEVARAVAQAETFGYDVHNVYDVVREVGTGEVHGMADPTERSVRVMGEEVDSPHDKVLVELTAQVPVRRILDWTDVEVGMPEPDLMVCRFCREAFGGDGDGA